MPVLRQAPAQARAEARARRDAEAAEGAAPAALAGAPEAGGDAGDPGRAAPVRDDRAGARVDRRDDPLQRGPVLPRRPRARRGRHRRVVADRDDAVRLLPERLPGGRARAPCSCSAGCSSAGTDRGRRCWCSSRAARAAWRSRSWPATPTWRSAPTAPRSRCCARGPCATCSAAAAARRTTRTCSASSRSPSCCVLLPLAAEEASGVAGLGGAAIGLLLGLPLARLPER